MRRVEITPCMFNTELGQTKHDSQILERYKTIKRLIPRDEDGFELPPAQKPQLQNEDSEQDYNYTKRFESKTFFNGATSMYFGAEPTYRQKVSIVDSPKNLMKR